MHLLVFQPHLGMALHTGLLGQHQAPLASRAPKGRILVFTMSEQTVFAVKALEAGARGYLSKNSTPEGKIDASLHLAMFVPRAK